MTLTFDEYATKAKSTAVYPKLSGLNYLALGVAGEAGEVADQVKKMIRDDASTLTGPRQAKLRAELGDVLWYVAMMATELGIPLSDIAQGNLDKLADRKARSKLQGSGDTR